MTRDDLIDAGILALMNAERAQINLDPLDSLDQAILNDVEIIRPQVEAVADAFFAALREQTEEMTFAARHLMMWLTGGRPSEKNLKFWCERRGLPVPVGCEDIDHVPPKSAMAAWVFEAMLNASPLAPEGGRT